MKASRCLSILWGFVLAASAAHASPESPEQTEVKRFVQKMYSYDPATFEHGNFGGKYLPAQHCQLIREYYDEGLIKTSPNPAHKTKSCDIGYWRYPTLDSEDVSLATRLNSIPKPKIYSPVLSGDKAKVAVITGGPGTGYEQGRSLFFLRKTDQGWRVRNVLAYERWPDSVIENRVECKYDFATPPLAEELLEVRPECRRSQY